MSFAYLPWYTGDYLRDTRHLSPLRHGVYLLLLAHCWDQKGPVPLDEQEAAGIANCRSSDEIEALRYVLARYFVRMDDGHYNPRMQKEIEKSENLSSVRSAAGRKGYEAKAKQVPSKSLTRARNAQETGPQASAKQVPLSPSPSPSLSPTPNQEKTTPPAAATSSPAAPPAGVDPQVWRDWLALRRQKRAPVTPTALRQIQREADKAGMPLEKALEVCCNRGWTGFRADWVEQARGKDIDFDRLIRDIEQERGTA